MEALPVRNLSAVATSFRFLPRCKLPKPCNSVRNEFSEFTATAQARTPHSQNKREIVLHTFQEINVLSTLKSSAYMAVAVNSEILQFSWMWGLLVLVASLKSPCRRRWPSSWKVLRFQASSSSWCSGMHDNARKRRFSSAKCSSHPLPHAAWRTCSSLFLLATRLISRELHS